MSWFRRKDPPKFLVELTDGQGRTLMKMPLWQLVLFHILHNGGKRSRYALREWKLSIDGRAVKVPEEMLRNE